ncbi:MAG: hypothetical protein HY319_15310 [Armatimonadetes bacterium]|nr:hypothetical protein [Armatimonadota bacterium]
MRYRFRWLDLVLIPVLIALGAALSNPDGILSMDHRRVGPPGLEPCWASLEGDTLVLRFENPSTGQLILQVGRGAPPCTLVQEDGPVFVPQFTCPADYEHDCFHADSLKLAPGTSAELTYPAARIQGMTDLFRRRLRQGEMPCWYRSPPLSPERADGSIPASIVDGRVVLRFDNPGTSPKRLTLGRGEPEYLFQPGEKPVLMAGFSCPSQYVHDCDHYEILEIPPGETLEVALQTPPSNELRSQIELTGACWYISRAPQERP